MNKTISLSAIFVLTLLLFASCSTEEKNAEEVEPIVLEAQAGKTVFELLKEQHEIDYSESSMGVFIKSINGIENSGGRYWLYEINGEPGKNACNKAVVSEGDKVVWRYTVSEG